MIRKCLFVVAELLAVVSASCTTIADAASLSEGLATFVTDLARQVLAAGLL